MFPLFYITSCNSTNDEVNDYLAETQCNAAIYTFNQVRGRGQYGNIWKSEEDVNVAYSLALKVKHTNLPPNLFNYHTAVIVRDFIANLTDADVKIKWPNDLIINGKKISGMLIEQRKIDAESYYIIGIGINVLQKDFQHLPKAGSIFTQTKKVFSLADFVEQFHQYLSETIVEDITDERVLTLFNAHLFRKDEISVFQIQGLRQNGIIKYADQEGFLWVELEYSGLKRFYHKEIELLY